MEPDRPKSGELPAELQAKEPAEPLLPACPVEAPPAPVAPHEEPLEVDPVAEPGASDPPVLGAQAPETTPTLPATAPRTVQALSRKRDHPGLFRHYRRHLNLLMLFFLFVGAAGWTYRWQVFREVLLQLKQAELPDRRARDAWPLLCETLLADRTPERRVRAANLLAQDGRRPARQRGAQVWDALQAALADPDPAVEGAAWESLRGVGLGLPHTEPGLAGWLGSLPVVRCVDTLRRTKTPSIRKGLLKILEDANAEAYWKTARWSLLSLDDPDAVGVVLDDVRHILYPRRGAPRAEEWTSMLDCVAAGLENRNLRIRDRCRRLTLDYAFAGRAADEFVDWIRTTRDVSTIDRVVHLIRVNTSLDWETPLKRHLAEETDFDAAVELSVALANMVGQERDREFLEAGLENPDPKIREYFEQLLAQPPIETAPPVEPEDGR